MYVTEDLIEQIKENTSTEFTQGRFSQSTVIDLCNQESLKRIRPIVSDLQKEFFVISTSVSVAANTTHIRLPKRAAGRGLREIYLTVDTERHLMIQITREQSTTEESTSSGIPRKFYFEADSIVFERPISSAATLNLILEVSPGNLVLSTATTKVSSVDFDTGIVVAAGTPSGYGGTVEYDFVQQLGYGNAVLACGLTPSSVSGTSYTFDPDVLPKTLKAGDYITLAGQTPVPNMPDEAVACLIHAVSTRIYRMRGDYDGVKSEQQELQNAILYLQQALADRIEGQRTTVHNTSSLLRSSSNRRLKYL